MPNDRRNVNSMSVCFVSHSAYVAGAERALLEAIKSLTDRGITCHVLLPYKGPLCEELSKLNVAFRVVKYQPWVYGGSMSWWRRMRSLFISLVMVIPVLVTILRWRSSIVYTNTTTVFTGAVAAYLTGRPHIWHVHEYGYLEHGLRFICGKKFSLSLISRLSVLCIAASKAIADALQGFIPPSKLKVIYQSVSVSNPVMPAQIESSAFKCIFVGQIAEGKNQEEAIMAVAELVKRGMNIELYLIGNSYEDYTARLNSLIARNGIQDNVRFLGFKNDAYSYMCIADVVLMCSRSEGFGRVTVEGMLAGKVIIGARSGATTELVEDGVTGLLYTLGAYKELAQKIEYVFNNPAQAELMGKSAKEWASAKFSQERYGDDLMQALFEVGKSGNRRSKPTVKARSNDLL
ncbi:MAG: glycosyltransferase family 4 protein [Nitrospira sp.]|nr:MAG: glycosyltransferase family 4 protein [Nitrospira sp.]